MRAFTGKILRVDLCTHSIKIETIEEKIYRKYPGGGLLGAYYCLKEIPPRISPLDTQNILIFSPGILAGTQCPGSDLICVTAKSPLTKGIGASESNGKFAAGLKRAGFDAIIIQGKSPNPAYIYIDSSTIEIRSAKKIWGLSTGEASDILKKETQEDVSIAAIGIAGENLVNYASIVQDYAFANARMGMGAVMGSKNLKAIVVRGTKTIDPVDPTALEEIYCRFESNYLNNFVNKSMKETGTINFIPDGVKDGMIGSRNFQRLDFNDAGTLVQRLLDDYGTLEEAKCGQCPGVCQRIIDIPAELGDKKYGAPTIEAVTDFGINLAIKNPETIIKAYIRCQELGLDITSTGVVLSFAVECCEKGIIKKKDIDEVDLTFGEERFIIPMLEKIAARDGIGDILACGTKEAAEILGGDSAELAMQSKGKELPLHDPRRKKMLGIGYAVSPTGPDTFISEHDNDYIPGCPEEFMWQIEPLGLTSHFNLEDLSPQKIRLFIYLQQIFSFMDGLGLCIHAFAPCRYLPFKDVVEMLRAVTGWNISLFELMKLGEKRINLLKMFNLREGINDEEDILPERFFQPIKEGEWKEYKLEKDIFEKAKKMYYDMMNWDRKGVPREGKLVELELEFIVER